MGSVSSEALLHEVTAQGHTVHNFATKRYKSVEHAKKLLPDLRVVDIRVHMDN